MRSEPTWNQTPDNFVPKVHPATRPVEPDDPMNLFAVEVPGDPELMLRLLVEEYARMGWGLDALLGLFRDPFYVAAHGLWLHYGEEELKRRLSDDVEARGRRSHEDDDAAFHHRSGWFRLISQR